MQVLRNHFEGKTTVVINENILADGRCLSLAKYKEFCEEYVMPEETLKSVVEAYREDLELEECNIHEHIKDKDMRVLSAIAKFGNDTHRDILLSRTDDLAVACAIAEFGNDYHRDALTNSRSTTVRQFIAEFGNDSHRDALLNDEEWPVRYFVATNGSNYHRDILLKDKNKEVRRAAKRYYKGELK